MHIFSKSFLFEIKILNKFQVSNINVLNKLHHTLTRIKVPLF